MKQHQISEELLNKILQVMGSMPYVQVAGIILELTQELKLKSKKKEEPKKDEGSKMRYA